MRTAIRLVALASGIVVSGAGCGAAGDGSRTIRLRAHVPIAASPVVGAGGMKGIGAAVAALSASDAVKVILSSQSRTTVVPVTGGVFEVDAAADAPAALILVGPGDAFLGFVAVRGIIPIVPLQAADDATTELDLGTLVAQGTTIVPGNDPIGHGVTLSDAEIQALADLGWTARQILAAPDVDGDAIIDYLQGRQYALQLATTRSGTIAALAGDVPGPVVNWGFSYNVVEDGIASYPPFVSITGPSGSGIDEPQCMAYLPGFQNAMYALPRLVAGSAPPAGTWTSGYGARTLTFEVPDLTALASAAPALVPTVTLNPDQTVHSIAWTWRMADGTTSVTPSNFAVDVMLGITGNGSAPRCAANGTSADPSSVYAIQVPADAIDHVLACQDIPWADVTELQLGYHDVFNNNHTTGYQHP